MKIVDEKEIASIVLIELYHQFITDQVPYGDSVSVDHLLEECAKNLPSGRELGKNATHMALDDLADEGAVKLNNADISRYVAITTAGVRRARVLLRSDDTEAASYWKDRNGFEKTSTGTEEELDVGTVGASVEDDKWEPLPVDRDSPSFHEMLTDLEKVKEEFRKENGFASVEPNKKEAILDALESGIQTLKSKVMTRATVDVLVLSPLKFLIRTFSNAAIGELAKIAIAAVKNFFGL